MSGKVNEFEFTIMPITALPKGDSRSITPYWHRLLLVLRDLPADQAIFVKHDKKDPSAVQLTRMRHGYASQVKRYMPDEDWTLKRDLLRGGVFIFRAAAAPDIDGEDDDGEEDEESDDDDTTNEQPKSEPATQTAIVTEICSCSNAWIELWEGNLKPPAVWPDAGFWHQTNCSRWRRPQEFLRSPDENDDNAGMVGASGEAGFNADSKTTQSPDPIDEDVGAYVEPLTPEEQEDDDLGAFPFQGEVKGFDAADLNSLPPNLSLADDALQPVDVQKPKAKAKATRGEDPKPDPFGCGCPSWWRATPAFRKYAPDKSGPYHHDACPRRCSWEAIDHVGACSCTPTPGDIAAQASKSTAVEHTADAWFEPGDWHGKRCARHVHRFRLPPAGSGSLAGVQVGVCICGELKGHSNERVGAGAGKPEGAPNAES